MNYFVINLCECEIIAECLSVGEASIALENAVQESDGFYTEDDFAILDEEELDAHGFRD